MTETQDPGTEPPELILESESEVEDFADESGGRSTIMPWLVPILIIVAFFVFVALLVLFIV